MHADQVLTCWENCLNDNDLQGIIDLYEVDAVLWGTFSKNIRDKQELIKEYFYGLFEKKQLKVQFGKKSSRQYSSVYIFSGTYKFSYLEDEVISFPARYTFVISKNSSGDYKIVEHHSSLMPS